MNSYERVMTALAVRQPDRVPIVEFVISPAVVRRACPGAETQNEFEERMGLDAVCCSARFERVRQNADGTYADEWGVVYCPGTEVVDHPIRGPIRDKDDFARYAPPDPEAPHRLGNLAELVSQFKGKKAIIFHQRAAFMWSAYLNGIDNLLVNFLAEPDFAHELMDMVLGVMLGIARRAIRTGADIIVLGDDYAGNKGPMFSPAVFRTFVLPRLKKMVDTIHEEGGKVVKHSDGKLWLLLDDMVGAGIDGLNPIEAVAGMDLGEVKRKCGSRVCLIGNVDCAHMLSHGTVEEVDAAVRVCMQQGAPGGGYMLSSSNSIHSGVRPENYLAMIAAGRKYGVYPLLEREAITAQ
jgi:uroporphyrinogen decarboxylase